MSAFAPPATRPVRLHEVTQVIGRETGEVIGWKGLNTDLDRCPAEFCGNCPKQCRCAPCRCSECVARELIARGADQTEHPRRQLA